MLLLATSPGKAGALSACNVIEPDVETSELPLEADCAANWLDRTIFEGSGCTVIVPLPFKIKAWFAVFINEATLID